MSMVKAVELWGKACQHLQQTLHPDVYSRWIAVIQPLDLVDHAITLSVDNDFYQSWLEENYLPLILGALTAVTGSEWTISFSVNPKAAASSSPPPPRKKTVRDRPARNEASLPALNPKFVPPWTM